MGSRTQELKQKQLNLEQWQKLYYQNQQSYLRARLLAIKFLAEGKSRKEVSQLGGNRRFVQRSAALKKL